MTFNHVTVTGQWTDGVTFGEGNFLFDAEGDLMNSTTTAIVTPVIKGQLDTTGKLWTPPTLGSGVSLLASDNFLTGQLNWHILLRVQGWPIVDVADVPVLFSNGASQTVFSILEAAGWTSIGS